MVPYPTPYSGMACAPACAIALRRSAGHHEPHSFFSAAVGVRCLIGISQVTLLVSVRHQRLRVDSVTVPGAHKVHRRADHTLAGEPAPACDLAPQPFQ